MFIEQPRLHRVCLLYSLNKCTLLHILGIITQIYTPALSACLVKCQCCCRLTTGIYTTMKCTKNTQLNTPDKYRKCTLYGVQKNSDVYLGKDTKLYNLGNHTPHGKRYKTLQFRKSYTT